VANTYDDMSLIIQTLLGVGSESIAIEIESFIQINRVAGMSDEQILGLLQADLDQGGRIFGQLKNSLKNIVRGAIASAARIAGLKVYEEEGILEYQWLTVGDSCPDCERREGMVADMESFNLIGAPGTGWSLCREACDCDLVPVGYRGATKISKKNLQIT